MAADSDEGRLIYEARNDPTVSRAYLKAHRSENWGTWLGWAFRSVLYFIGIPTTCYLLGWEFSTDNSGREGLTLLLVVAIVYCGFWFRHAYTSHIETNLDADRGEVWTCELTKDAWTFARKNGVLTSIPWKLMEIGLEGPDFWEVRYGRFQVLVFRQPLRRAGLEGEFLRRIKRAALADQAAETYSP